LIKAALASGAAVLGYKWWMGRKEVAASYTLTQGHSYTAVFAYTGTPAAPLAATDLQTALNSSQGGTLFTVSGAPSTDAVHKLISANLTYSGSTGSIPASSFVGGFPSAVGTVTVRQMVDTGSPFAGLETEANTLLGV
jgi:hypothetical protein